MKSEVTSSHWEIEGQGFGNLCPTSIKTIITHFPELIYARYLLYKHNCNPFIEDAGQRVLEKQNRLLGFDSAKQMLSLSEIHKSLGLDWVNIRTVCVIGDGYGFFASLIKEFDKSIDVISINLEKIERRYDRIYSTTPNIVYIHAENYEKLKDETIDLFVNIVSMQEMNPPVIQNYFTYMRESKGDPIYFYCCNRMSKQLPDGTLINFQEYPWGDEKIIFDELCPWYQRYMDIKPPFIHKFDGAIWHKLVIFKEGNKQ